ncbi:MAG TPA: type II toxin-antitoxin system prevent-host-death family antitoxin [Pyrinomonadaceae bacterium]|nr:type II toxin-antitoxin system prevent-host-death family antitoxin [Pyrinomonadaceae bacterium]
MPIQTSYSNARNNLASLLERVSDEQEIVIINRRGHEDVALVSASELSSLFETAHLLRSPKNATRLLKALHRAQAKTEKPETLEKLQQEFGIEKRKKL